MSFLSCFRWISKGSKSKSTEKNQIRFSKKVSEKTSPARPKLNRQTQLKTNSPSEIRYNTQTEQISFEQSERDVWHAPTSNQISLDNVSALYAKVNKSKRSPNIVDKSEDFRQASLRNTSARIENQTKVYSEVEEPSIMNQRTTRISLPIGKQDGSSYSRDLIRESSTNLNQANILRQDSFDTALYASCYADGRMSGSDLYAEILVDNTSTSSNSINPNPTSASQLTTYPNSNARKSSDVNNYSMYISRL